MIISRLGSLGVYQKAVYFYCCVVNVSTVKFTEYDIWIWWIMVKWIVVMKIQPSICLDDWGKPRKNLSQVGRHRDLNPGPPECESRALPRSHLARLKNINLSHTLKKKKYIYIFPVLLSYFAGVYCGLFLFIIIEYCRRHESPAKIAGNLLRMQHPTMIAEPNDDRWRRSP